MKTVRSRVLSQMALLPIIIGLTSLPWNEAVASEPPWPMQGGNPLHNGVSPTILPNSVQVKFHTTVGRYGYGGVIVGLDENGEDVIFGNSGDSTFGEAVWAVDSDGNLIWKTTLPDDVGLNATPYLDQDAGILYLSAYSANALVAIDATNGDVLWKKTFVGNGEAKFFSSSPTPGPDGTLYIMADGPLSGSSAGLFAIRPDGELAWFKNLEPYSTGEGAVAVVDGGDVIVVTNTFAAHLGGAVSRILRLSPTGETIWDVMPPELTNFHSFAYGTPAIAADGTIHFGTRPMAAGSNFLLALNSDGTVSWTTQALSSRASPAVGFHNVYMVDTESRLAAIRRSDGELSWTHPVGQGVDANRSAPIVDPCENVVVASTGGKMSALTREGDLLWETTFEGQGLGSIAVGATGTLYVRGAGLYAFHGTDAVDCDPIIDPGQPDAGVDAGLEEAGVEAGIVDAGAEAAEEPDSALQGPDASDQPDGGAGGAGGAGGEDASPPSGPTVDTGDDSGCGCSLPSRSPGGILWFTLALLILAARRKNGQVRFAKLC